jgi:hypothetical protein
VLWNQQLAAVYNAQLAGPRGAAIHLDRLLAAQGELVTRELLRDERRLPRGLWLLLYEHAKGLWLDEGTRSLEGRVELGGQEHPDLELVLAHNWTGPDSEGAVGFRRVKGRTARLRVPIRTPGDFTVVVRLRSEVPEAQQRFTLAVNGRLLGEAALTPQWSEHGFELPAAALRPGFNEVELTFAVTPRALRPDHAGRDTPAAVDWLRFQRAAAPRPAAAVG